jgi:hypothetical protein
MSHRNTSKKKLATRTRHPYCKKRPSAYFDGGRCGHWYLGLRISLLGKHLVLSDQVPGEMCHSIYEC